MFVNDDFGHLDAWTCYKYICIFFFISAVTVVNERGWLTLRAPLRHYFNRE